MLNNSFNNAFVLQSNRLDTEYRLCFECSHLLVILIDVIYVEINEKSVRMSQLNASTSERSVTSLDVNQFKDNTNTNRSVSGSDKRKALNTTNNNSDNCNHNKYNSLKKVRIDSEDIESDLKMSENTIAVNNSQNNRFPIGANGVKGSQLGNSTKPGTAKKLIIKNFGQFFNVWSDLQF